MALNIFRFSLLFFCTFFIEHANAQSKPNVILIYADDLGYGDLSCYGATKLKTPNMDKLASQGIRFTNGHCTSSSCTPSRYALITGQYPWRKKGTGILPGDAALIIPTGKTTLPKVFKNAGYKTGIVGKWHLGLGDKVSKNWNGEIKPGPNEVGFDYSFIFPATADRVPTVFIENKYIIGKKQDDSIFVNYKQKVGSDPTGKDHPELLKMTATNGHDNTIVNGIGRIGFMAGGKTARWTDEELGFTFLLKAEQFIEENKSNPFFLYYALTEPHAPRMPATVFKEKSGIGLRGDAILQIDWAVGEVMKQLVYLGIEKNTIIILSSDNGPVLIDGYDDADIRSNGHTPAGPLRGGKYSTFEGGTRVPFIVSWPGTTPAKVSNALVSQIDFAASFASLFNQTISQGDLEDSKNTMAAFLGKSDIGTPYIIEDGLSLGFAIVKDNWKYIEANARGPKKFGKSNIESGLQFESQLYNLSTDLAERNSLSEIKFPDKFKELKSLMESIRGKK